MLELLDVIDVGNPYSEHVVSELVCNIKGTFDTLNIVLLLLGEELYNSRVLKRRAMPWRERMMVKGN